MYRQIKEDGFGKKEAKQVKRKREDKTLSKEHIDVERFQNLEEEVKAISQKIDTLIRTKSVPTQQAIAEENINPWALEAVKIWEATVKSTGEQVSRSISTYRKTIKALFESGKPLAATEIGKITKRTRNTETSYLRRLYLAGFIDRIPDGKKVKYCIEKEKKDELQKAFKL